MAASLGRDTTGHPALAPYPVLRIVCRACSQQERRSARTSGPTGRETTGPRHLWSSNQTTPLLQKGGGSSVAAAGICRGTQRFWCAVGSLVVGWQTPGVCLPCPEEMIRAGWVPVSPWPCFPAATVHMRPPRPKMRIQGCQWVEQPGSGMEVGDFAPRDSLMSQSPIEASLCLCGPLYCGP
jgi:hypothetical protein